MTKQPRKTSSKSQQLWTRFETSGSIQAYLRFRNARQAENEGGHREKAVSVKAQPLKRGTAKTR
jgi:hypothetical protein